MNSQQKIIPFILLTILVYSCTENRTEKTGDITLQQSRSFPKNKPGSSFNDTLQITSPAAVFYMADSLQLIKINSLMDPGAFAANMHEYENLFNTSRSVLQKTYSDLEIKEAKNVRYLVFDAGTTPYLIDLDKQYEPCGLYAFDGKNPPQLIDMANAETSLGFLHPQQ